MTGPVVVKLGGSLLEAAELRPWLAALAILPGAPRVVVPGGGPFADTVRDAQARLGFHDLAAHRMAILAMQQYGLMLQALEPRLALAETSTDLAAIPPGAGAVWLPWRMVGLEPGIEPSWDVTSDSLALWLAATPELAATPACEICRLAARTDRSRRACRRRHPGRRFRSPRHRLPRNDPLPRPG